MQICPMRTTLDIPDELFREVKATAARRGMMMRQFVAEALREKLRAGNPASRPWKNLSGLAAREPGMREELQRIDKLT
jgi:metal-responsive CopG/Arc/MetJ family transcriptional regulator